MNVFVLLWNNCDNLSGVRSRKRQVGRMDKIVSSNSKVKSKGRRHPETAGPNRLSAFPAHQTYGMLIEMFDIATRSQDVAGVAEFRAALPEMLREE